MGSPHGDKTVDGEQAQCQPRNFMPEAYDAGAPLGQCAGPALRLPGQCARNGKAPRKGASAATICAKIFGLAAMIWPPWR